MMKPLQQALQLSNVIKEKEVCSLVGAILTALRAEFAVVHRSPSAIPAAPSKGYCNLKYKAESS